LTFKSPGKRKSKSLKREDYWRKKLEIIRKNMFTESIVMLILIFRAIRVTKLRKSLNLFLMMRSRKQKKHLKLKRSSKEMIVMIWKIIILEHRPDSFTVINAPIQDNIVPVEIQPVVKHRRIFQDD
jgi:hypothetical protein